MNERFKRNIKTALAGIGLVTVAYLSLAGVDNRVMPTLEGLGVLAEHSTGIVAGDGFAGVLVYFEADDTGPWAGPGVATLDTGDEACAVYGMTCSIVWTITTGTDADITVDADGCTSATSIADGAESLAICH